MNKNTAIYDFFNTDWFHMDTFIVLY